ncbi:TIGR04295 family B12-binding domain-containing radical SAM protein [Desulfomonile tiedjei]|uniref:Fe-S oxidoreductase n=1 Tax=Desulfomonile tiedjei (strain ATCC 49306 / DSM 6799 / DCB-1) TaxID=706587 RepID=I4C682_DESTA|nr:TIGR04295 family B12-binding domain-containing radical SAM protein [Desulfomonile tiedjei]AFM25073.1 Fe-S oxidoreductase [Desulfomonile tiedjei DSM 6799]
MKFALVNPNWTFHSSVYFGCRSAHFPLELGYAKAILESEGHEAIIIDAHLFDLALSDLHRTVSKFAPNFTILLTAPTYLFWRCPPPELREPQIVARALRKTGGRLIAAGPHGSITPECTREKLGIDAVIRGECEDVVSRLFMAWEEIPSLHFPGRTYSAQPNEVDLNRIPALIWPDEWVARHAHHHHRFETVPEGPGAEVESSRGCPFRCIFCAKEYFRTKYRRRPLKILFDEIDRLQSQGVKYLYFIDETFFPRRELLNELALRDIKFGIQTRIDLWNRETLALLGKAGCVSIEAGVESITDDGRNSLQKDCRKSTKQITDLLVTTRQFVPFVQANLIRVPGDNLADIREWRETLQKQGIWANDPVPMFPYPGSPAYRQLWGSPDSCSWERAHRYYLAEHSHFSDIQNQQPMSLEEVELSNDEVTEKSPEMFCSSDVLSSLK